MRLLFRYLLLLVLCVGIVEPALAQHTPSKERGDPTKRRKNNIDGNLLRATIFNFGFEGRTGVVPDEIPFEWPKNTRQHYIALVALFVGGEVRDRNGQKIQIVDLPNYRQSLTGKSWNLEPVPGYLRDGDDSKIAKSSEPETWPLKWPDKKNDAIDPYWSGSWNGYFGKNQFNADQEMYYKASDDGYDRYLSSFKADTTDASRAGLGILMDVRVMEWSQVLVNDDMFILHNITNDGSFDITRAGVTLWLADLVGGDGDSQDDRPYFDLLADIAWMTDGDGVGNSAFGNTKVGVAAISYLETPGNAVDRIDNDGDGEDNSPKITTAMLAGEISGNGIDDNRNGLIDEDSTHIAFFGNPKALGFADGIDNNDNGEPGGSTVTQQMIDQASADPWRRWPPNPENDPVQAGIIHLIGVGQEDLGKRFKDNIDNDGNSYGNWPTVTQAMINQAATDIYHRYRVPGTNVILYDLGPEDLGKKYIDKDKKRDPGIDEGIDEMIDESRDDGIDNDGDWNPLTDDVGLDGLAGTGDFGEGDGKPTSGANTNFPGEPNVDKTDVSESDQIGLTNVQYKPAGVINFSTASDRLFWDSFMTPGSFYDPTKPLTGDNDLFVSSGFFPLRSGQTERISIAVVMGSDQNDATANKKKAQETYNEDYQFAKAPIAPEATAVAGDRRVTIYWDSKSEQSFDSFLAALGQPGYDFEGYRIYRATDPAFLDAFKVTDASGNLTYYKPIAQFDKDDHITGLHPVSQNGAQFYLGSDTGLRHEFVDTTVQDGQTYYYAVTGYDYGWTGGNIGPSESPIAISVNPDGSVVMGKNVVKVVPAAPVAGYVPPSVANLVHTKGSSTGKIDFVVVDPYKIKDNLRYKITFRDTLIPAKNLTAQDTLRTASFSLLNISNPSSLDTLIKEGRGLAPTSENPVVDGFRLKFQNENSVSLNSDLSKWSRSSVHPMTMQPFNIGLGRGTARPADYIIVFGDVGMDTSVEYRPAIFFPMPSIPVNFKIINLSENKRIKFAFKDVDTTGGPGKFTVGSGFDQSDIIGFFEKNAKDSLVLTWRFNVIYDSAKGFPKAGDTAFIVIKKPFLSVDEYEFTTDARKIDKVSAKNQLDQIKVVPNPYIAGATWEPRNPYASGRGPRSIHFNHLPSLCTIRIYNVNGELVATVNHTSADKELNGSAEWNLLSHDNLPVSYGVYIYHVDAPGVGEKIGRFAIIK